MLRQLVGRRAALDVTADVEPLAPAAAYRLREPNRLDWCLRTTADGPDLRWADCHRTGGPCPHPHVIDHQCTAPAAPPERPRTTRKPPAVPDGQLTL
ncbi:hypothetical protein [Streptomyces pini]|uniref:hypothetical protein n=1 Tax=Streptomyces pini TaxID=1520580 RepID=UPI001FE67A3E|nr:hypothetical protein [Streptomyces pini]